MALRLGSVGSAVVQIKAEFDQYRRDLANVRRETSRAADVMNRSMQLVRRGVVGLSAAAAGAGAAYMALARQAMAHSAALVDASDRVNANIERLQELRFAAEQMGASSQLMDEALRRLTRRMSLFAQDGGGPAAKAIEALGISVLDAEGNLRQSSDVFDEIVAKLETYENQAEAAALASGFFGENAGPVLLPLLQSGSRGVAEFTERARELGMVLDEAGVRKAADAKARLDQLSASIRHQLMAAVIDNTDSLETMAETIENRIIPVISSLIGRMDDLAEAVANALDWSGLTLLAEMDRFEAMHEDAFNRPGWTEDDIFDLPEVSVTLPPTRPRARPDDIKPETSSRSGGGGGSSLQRELEREAEMRERLLEIGERELERLQLEIDTRGMTAAQVAEETYRRESLSRAKRDGLDLDAVSVETGQTLRQEIEAQAQAIGVLTDELDDGSINAEAFGQALSGAIMQANSLEDAAKRVALAIAEMALQAALFGSGPMGGGGGGLMGSIFPTLFNEKGNVFLGGRVVPFAKGGVVEGATAFPMRGGVGVMGEAGPEAILPLARGPDGSLGVRSEGGGRQQVEVVVTVDNAGAIQAYVRDQVGGALDAYDSGLADRVADIRDDPSYRG